MINKIILRFSILIFFFLQINIYGQLLIIDSLILNHSRTNASIKTYSLEDSLYGLSGNVATKFVESNNNYHTIIYDSLIIHFENGFYIIKKLNTKQKPKVMLYPVKGLSPCNVYKDENNIMVLDCTNDTAYILKLTINMKLIVKRKINIQSESGFGYLCDNGNTIFTVNNYGLIEKINIYNNIKTYYHCLKNNKEQYIQSIKQSPDKRYLAILGYEGDLSLIDLLNDSIVYQDTVYSNTNSLYFDNDSKVLFYPSSKSVVKYIISNQDTMHIPLQKTSKLINPNAQEGSSLIEIYNIFSNADSFHISNNYPIDDLDIMHDTVYYVSTNIETQYLYSFPLDNPNNLIKSKNMYTSLNMNLGHDIGKKLDGVICQESKRIIQFVLLSGYQRSFDLNYNLYRFDPFSLSTNTISLLSSNGDFIMHVTNKKYFDIYRQDTVKEFRLFFRLLDNSKLSNYFFTQAGFNSFGIPNQNEYTLKSACISNNNKYAFIIFSNKIIKFDIVKGIIEETTILNNSIKYIKNIYSLNTYLIVTDKNEFGFVKENNIGYLENVLFKAEEEVIDVQLDDLLHYIIVRYKDIIVVYDFNFKQVFQTRIMDNTSYIGFKLYKSKLLVFYSKNVNHKSIQIDNLLNEYYYDEKCDCLYLINSSNEITKFMRMVN